jgi:hypothetical protein
LDKAWQLKNARRERRARQEKIVLPSRHSRSGWLRAQRTGFRPFPRRPAHILHSMNTIKPLSLKIRPEVRNRIKSVAYKMEWSEHQLAKNALEAALDMMEANDSAALNRLAHLCQAARAFKQTTSDRAQENPYHSSNPMSDKLRLSLYLHILCEYKFFPLFASFLQMKQKRFLALIILLYNFNLNLRRQRQLSSLKGERPSRETGTVVFSQEPAHAVSPSSSFRHFCPEVFISFAHYENECSFPIAS